ncbi:MAG: hypothetical protein JWP92_3556 [Caulobacter sp.]|nr:hypothetical protein [Caulobacter sp.]
MSSLIVAAALLLQQAEPAAPPPAVEAVVVDAPDRTPRPPGPIPDKAIADQLNALLVQQPDRVVCLSKMALGSRLPVPLCATLRGWYDFEASRTAGHAKRKTDGGAAGPPYELVDLIKARMRNPRTRALAEARAGARLAAEEQARADQP